MENISETVEEKMRSSAIEKLKLESKVCQEDNVQYGKSSPMKKVDWGQIFIFWRFWKKSFTEILEHFWPFEKPKIELDQKLDDTVIDEEISQDELVDFLDEKSWLCKKSCYATLLFITARGIKTEFFFDLWKPLIVSSRFL